MYELSPRKHDLETDGRKHAHKQVDDESLKASKSRIDYIT